MIFDRIMLPAQGRNEDYKFAQTGSVRFVAGVGGAGGAESTPSWLENVIKLDPESGFLSVDDWHVKGDLVIEGQVNQWLAQQLVVDDARMQVNRKQDGAVVDSGLVIFDKDTSSEVSSLVYDVNGVWKAGGDRLFTEAYNPKLGGYAAGDYPRKAENAVITGAWKFEQNVEVHKGNDFAAVDFYSERSSGNLGGLRFFDADSNRVAHIYAEKNGTITIGNTTEGASSNKVWLRPSGHFGIGIVPTERLHVAGNGLFTGGLTAGGNVSAPTFVSGFAGSGWRLEAGEENHLTIDRLTVRGRMDVYELVVNQIRGTNGALWVSDSAKVASVSGNRLFIDTGGDTSFVPFVVNDLLRCQRWNGNNIKYYVVRVTAVGSNYIDVVLVDGSSPREAGDYLVRMGNTEDTDRQGALYLTSSDSNAPYMDVLDGVNSASFAGKTKVRIGKLDGITDPDLGTLSGYGLYTENGYFKGKIQVTGGNAATKADVDATIDNIEVGGRNYALNTSTPKTKSSWTGANNQALSLYVVNVAPEWEVGKQVTIAFDVEASGLAWSGGTARLAAQAYGNVTSYDGFGYKRFFSSGSQSSGSGQSLKTRVIYQVTLTAAMLTNQHYTFNVRCDYITAGTLTVKNFALFYGNKATDWMPNPKDVPSALDYLATAIQDGSTDIEGGLVNTNVLMVKDTNGKVSGGISGLASDNIGFWTGGTYQAAISNNANVIFRKDGSFSLAGGKISGTEEGDVTIDGSLITQHITTNYIEGLELNFTKGKVGGFNIESNSLTGGYAGDRVALYPQEFIAFLSGDGYKWAGLGNNVSPAISLTHAVGRFQNYRPTIDGNNIGVYIDVKGAGPGSDKNGRNMAVHVDNGDIYIRNGSIRAVREYINITLSNTVYDYLPIHRSFKFNIYSVGTVSYNEIRLPTKAQVESHFGTDGGISFDVLIVCNYESTKPLRIVPNPGVEFKGTNGNTIPYHGMQQGDTVKVIFLHNHWQISAISQ